MNSNTKIAHLESKIDQLESELQYINKLLVNVGFEEGITSLKDACVELIEEEQCLIKEARKLL